MKKLESPTLYHFISGLHKSEVKVCQRTHHGSLEPQLRNIYYISVWVIIRETSLLNKYACNVIEYVLGLNKDIYLDYCIIYNAHRIQTTELSLAAVSCQSSGVGLGGVGLGLLQGFIMGLMWCGGGGGGIGFGLCFVFYVFLGQLVEG